MRNRISKIIGLWELTDWIGLHKWLSWQLVQDVQIFQNVQPSKEIQSLNEIQTGKHEEKGYDLMYEVYSMKIGLWSFGEVKIDNYINSLNVNTPGKKICKTKKKSSNLKKWQ